jgi:DnaK suppressor protein
MDPRRAQELLAAARARLERQLRGRSPEPGDGEEEDPIDAGGSAEGLFEAELDEGLRDRLEAELGAIERAERRIAEGTYGLSVLSGEPIPDARLQAVPWAERTVEEEEAAR